MHVLIDSDQVLDDYYFAPASDGISYALRLPVYFAHVLTSKHPRIMRKSIGWRPDRLNPDAMLYTYLRQLDDEEVLIIDRFIQKYYRRRTVPARYSQVLVPF